MAAVLLDAYQEWRCPNCGLTDRTRPMPANATRFHPCPKLHDLTAPLVRAEMDCKVVALEREDELRNSIQRTGDDGKPYMAVETERADGSTDRAVFPECAVQAARAS
jgi:hypothetical protein